MKNIASEHICCAFSDKKCKNGYIAKKDWLTYGFGDGYVFRRLDARAKVFIEYGPAEKSWNPINADGYFALGCFWVSGQYKNKGYGKALLQYAIDDALAKNKNGIVAIVGTKKFHFMGDAKWLLRQGFIDTQKSSSGFSLLTLKLRFDAPNPSFNGSVLEQSVANTNGIVVYYSNRCPFTEFYVNTSLVETAKKRDLPLEIIKFETMQQSQSSPTPATIFSLFYNGKFITTDLSVCIDSKFDRIVGA